MAVKQFFRFGMIGELRTGASPALPDLVARRLQHFRITRVFPKHKFLDNPEKTLAFLLLFFLCRKKVWIG